MPKRGIYRKLEEPIWQTKPEGEYDASVYHYLPVSAEVKTLFEYITKYQPKEITPKTKFNPVIPEYIPSLGDYGHAFLNVTRPDGKNDLFGLTAIDVPRKTDIDDGDSTETESDNEDANGTASESSEEETENESNSDDLDDFPDIEELFSYVKKYSPAHEQLDYKFAPFIPDYIASIGDKCITSLKVIRPDQRPDMLGICTLDEPRKVFESSGDSDNNEDESDSDNKTDSDEEDAD